MLVVATLAMHLASSTILTDPSPVQPEGYVAR